MSLPAEKQKEYDATIDFLEKTSSIIEIFHSFLPIKDINDDRLKEIEALLGWFTDWQLESHNAPATVSERKKMMISDKTLFDLQSMVIGFQEVCRETFREHPSTSILPWRINTNLVENIFCQQRALQGQNDNPRYIQYQSGMNSVLLGSRTSSSKSNTGTVESLPFHQPQRLRH